MGKAGCQRTLKEEKLYSTAWRMAIYPGQDTDLEYVPCRGCVAGGWR